MTPILIASENGHIDIVKFLASKVDDPNPPNNGGITPIHVATFHGHTEIVKFLATKIDNPNPPVANIPNNNTPLQIARRKKHSDIVKFLTSIIYPWYHYHNLAIFLGFSSY